METPYKYRIVITSEGDDHELFKYGNNPEDGSLETILWFDTTKDLNCLAMFEGLFYLLSVVKNDIAELSIEKNENTIGYGIFDYDSVNEDIKEYERKQNEQYSND